MQNKFEHVMTEVGAIIVVTMQADMATEDFYSLTQALLTRVKHRHAKTVVLDFSAIDLLDKTDLNLILAMLKATRMLGASSAICSLKQSLVCFMVDQDIEFGKIQFFHDLQETLRAFGQRYKK